MEQGGLRGAVQSAAADADAGRHRSRGLDHCLGCVQGMTVLKVPVGKRPLGVCEREDLDLSVGPRNDLPGMCAQLVQGFCPIW